MKRFICALVVLLMMGSMAMAWESTVSYDQGGYTGQFWKDADTGLTYKVLYETGTEIHLGYFEEGEIAKPDTSEDNGLVVE